MHELALADAVFRAARRAADEERLTSITSIAVEVGELQQIRKDLFEFALQEIRPTDDSRIADANVTVEILPARFRCRACARAFGLRSDG